MAEMIDREKILAKLREKSDGWRGTYTGDVYAYVQQMIKKASAVDAVEVTRCKDCKFWERGDCYRLELSRPDDFCSYGERKEDES